MQTCSINGVIYSTGQKIRVRDDDDFMCHTGILKKIHRTKEGVLFELEDGKIITKYEKRNFCKKCY